MDQENTTPAGEPEAAASSAVYKVRRAGSAGFSISKPKRNPRKLRQTRLKNRRRAR